MRDLNWPIPNQPANDRQQPPADLEDVDELLKALARVNSLPEGNRLFQLWKQKKLQASKEKYLLANACGGSR